MDKLNIALYLLLAITLALLIWATVRVKQDAVDTVKWKIPIKTLYVLYSTIVGLGLTTVLLFLKK